MGRMTNEATFYDDNQRCWKALKIIGCWVVSKFYGCGASIWLSRTGALFVLNVFRFCPLFVKRHRTIVSSSLILRVCSSCCRWLKGLSTWLILPVVICLSQRLSHACVSINKFRLWNCEWLIKSVIVCLMVRATRITVVILELIRATKPDFWKGRIY